VSGLLDGDASTDRHGTNAGVGTASTLA
jgi:hypothetical protein